MQIKPVINSNKLSPPGFYRDQIEGINKLYDFVYNPNMLEFTLAGAAGTGKTHMLKWFVNNVCNFPVCPTAPTHKAVRVIEKTLMRKSKTIQSLLGLRPNLDLASFSINNPQFDPRGEQHIKNYKLIIIDEAGMITDDTYAMILKTAKTYNTKILYVGDDYQLKPIQKNKSNGKVFNTPNKYTLREIVRQEEGNPLLQLFPLIRNDVADNTSKLLEYLFVNRHNENELTGYKLLTESNFNKQIDEYFTLDALKKDLDYVRVLAYTNDAVGKSNKYIRNKLLNSPNGILTQDDILTAYTTIVDEYNYPIIINSEDYYINTIRPYVNQYDIKTFAINLESAYDKRLTNTIQIVDHTDKSFAIYYKILNTLHYEAVNADKKERGKKWIKYFNFKNSILTMVTFSLNEANNFTTVKKDIDYGYAITCHKSQGSTFENVFVDLKDIVYHTYPSGKTIKRFDNDMINRLIYVALSRSKNKVIMKL